MVMDPPADGVRDEGLRGLLHERNGFFAFDRALHVFPSSILEAPVMTLEKWNDPSTWTSAYGDAASDDLFFAEDLFGMQFVLSDQRVFTFDPETGDRTPAADSISAWVELVLDDPAVVVGSQLAGEWQRRNGALSEGRRLVPVKPFILGGDFDLANLRDMSSVEAMLYRADLARQLRDVPDGSQVELQVEGLPSHSSRRP